MQVVKETDKIILNALDLQISKAELEGKNGSHSPSKIDLSTENETAQLSFSNPIDPALYTLHMEFTGEINDKMKGWYQPIPHCFINRGHFKVCIAVST